MNQLQGIIVPLLTPLTDDGRLDESGLERLVESLIGKGVHGLFACGTTAEALALTHEMRVRSFQVVARAAKGRVPVIAGLLACSMEEMLDYAREAKAAGLDVASIQPPMYYPLTDAQMNDFVEYFLSQLQMPAVLYNIPQFLGKPLPLTIVEKFASRSNVLGLKDSSGDMNYVEAAVAATRTLDFNVLMGNESRMLEGYRMGCVGGVASLANVYPEPCVACHEAGMKSDWEALEKAQKEVKEKLHFILSTGGNNWVGMIRSLKRELAAAGTISSGRMTRLFEP